MQVLTENPRRALALEIGFSSRKNDRRVRAKPAAVDDAELRPRPTHTPRARRSIIIIQLCLNHLQTLGCGYRLLSQGSPYRELTQGVTFAADRIRTELRNDLLVVSTIDGTGSRIKQTLKSSTSPHTSCLPTPSLVLLGELG